MISDRAVMFAGIVYALAFVAHIVEWAIGRTPAEPQAKVPVAASTGAAEAGASTTADAVIADDNGEGAGSDRELRVETYGRIGVAMTLIAAVLHGMGLLARGLATDPIRVPWGNMYEFTLAGTFGVAVIYLVLLRRYDLRWLGMVVTGFLVTVLMLDVTVLYKDAGPVMPALHSYWLVIHVLAAVVATGCFIVGGMLSAMYLVKERAARRERIPAGGFLDRLPDLGVLDRVSYRLHAIGFPIWTFAALIAGPIWAKAAWGSYWSWDPKEVWAFITWVVYAAYLHARATAGYKGRIAAIIALIGLATLLFNFVGINFFFGGGSQHSYAK
ncbi:MAG: c-type cytochrome biogenesis protein CcsB [Nocardioidaceae bacterium]|nr:MAG: c-type cytochrome biogenesis protein CcsB [Nocardioidaceae bacterium]